MFAIVVIGGMASVPGAILGAVYVFAMQYYMLPEWRFLATGVGLLAILLILPGGLGAGLAEARDGVLRFIARRRNIIVPSLLADRRDDSARGDAVSRRDGRAVEAPRRVERPGAVERRSWRCECGERMIMLGLGARRTARGAVQHRRDHGAQAARTPALLQRDHRGLRRSTRCIILFGLNAVDELDRTVFGVLGPEIRDALRPHATRATCR